MKSEALSWAIDDALELTKGNPAYDGELGHFGIAMRFGVDPEVVKNEWSMETVEEARAIMRAEARWLKRHPEARP